MTVRPGLHVVDNPPGQLGDGEAALVVIVHGTMDRASSFGRVTRRLGDLHVIRYDRRGYGRSRSLGTASFEGHVDDLSSVLAGRPAVLVGHSIGALVALAAAGRHPELVRGVLAYEPPTPWAPWWPTTAPAEDSGDEAEAFMRRAVGDRIWNRLPARTRADRRAEGPALRADVASVDARFPFDPATVQAAVIVGIGSQTSWWHQRAGEELAAALSTAEVAVVDGAEHGVHLSHPSPFADLVRRLVADGDGETAGVRQ